MSHNHKSNLQHIELNKHFKYTSMFQLKLHMTGPTFWKDNSHILMRHKEAIHGLVKDLRLFKLYFFTALHNIQIMKIPGLENKPWFFSSLDMKKATGNNWKERNMNRKSTSMQKVTMQLSIFYKMRPKTKKMAKKCIKKNEKNGEGES